MLMETCPLRELVKFELKMFCQNKFIQLAHPKQGGEKMPRNVEIYLGEKGERIKL